LEEQIGVIVKTVMTIIMILLSETSAANFKPNAYNWNAKAEELYRGRLAVPDLISLFTKEDVYIYQDIDIFGYTSRPVLDKATPIRHSD
jgi:hypothetical protein